MHEGTRQEVITNRSSNRSFGLVMMTFFLLIAALPLFSGHQVRLWALGIAAAFAGLGIRDSKVLTPLNRVWFKVGLLIHKGTSPIILGFMFYVVLTPVALILWVFSVDLLKLKFEPNKKTYWIDRSPPGPRPESLGDLF